GAFQKLFNRPRIGPYTLIDNGKERMKAADFLARLLTAYDLDDPVSAPYLPAPGTDTVIPISFGMCNDPQDPNHISSIFARFLDKYNISVDQMIRALEALPRDVRTARSEDTVAYLRALKHHR